MSETPVPDSENVETPQTPPPRRRPGFLQRLSETWPFRKRTTRETDALTLRPMTRGMQAFAMSLFFVFGLVAAAFLFWNPFGLHPFGQGQAEQGSAAGSGASAEPVQLYQCPMHLEVIEDQPGNCPICTMKLMPIAGPAQAAAPEAHQRYQCPMHPEVVEDEPGDCAVCKMKLEPMEGTASTRAAAGERRVLYWYAPMDPTYIRDAPGKSPMGMDLVPKYAEGGTPDAAGVIRIDPVQVQNMGVVSQLARIGAIERTVRTVGFLDFNADDITWINVKFSGWIEKVHVAYVGQEVKRGDPLFDIYSPELVTTQEEYLRALDYKASLAASERVEARRQAESLLRSTRDRLTYWDISEEQIEALEARRATQRRLTVFSPVDGVVTEVMEQALEGMFVKAGMNLYKIADLSTVWVHADVYETDLPWVRENQPAEVAFRHDPDRVFRGQILFLYPEVSKETRTLKICIEVPNRDRQLRAGMYADVLIHGPTIEEALLIPDAAVLRSGRRNLVFVDRGQGHFEPREVTLGIESDADEVQILSGLAAGDAVVTQAQFMLDSESRVQEAIAKFMKRRTAGPGSGGS